VCLGCGRHLWPKRSAGRSVRTSAGTARLRRRYLSCPRCRTAGYPLDARLGLAGCVSPPAPRRLCLAGARWSFDRAAAHRKEFCGLSVCDNTIRRACQDHGRAPRDGQRDAPAAAAAFRAADGGVEFQTDGTAVNTAGGGGRCG